VRSVVTPSWLSLFGMALSCSCGRCFAIYWGEDCSSSYKIGACFTTPALLLVLAFDQLMS
jgi:hypothetical protein